MQGKVTEFQGEYRFLSNFWIDDNDYCVEYFYQVAKCKNPEEAAKIMIAATPGQAKRAGRRVEIRDDWDNIKLLVMYILVRIKFKNEPLRSWLLNTGNRELEEGNHWGDKFWGVDLDTGEGENHLGKILMRVRDELRTTSF